MKSYLLVASSVLLISGAFPAIALADDPKEKADTIASTWTGGALRLSEKDKRFLFAFTSLFSGLRIRGEASSPFDDKTRTATFFSSAGLAPAFKSSFFVGYDSTYNALALKSPAEARNLEKLCQGENISPCSNSNLIRARRNNGKPLTGLDPFYWGLGIDLSFAYDRVKAYKEDIATKPRTFSSSDLQFGLAGTMYVNENFALSIRVGTERANAVELTPIKRCIGVSSSDPNITGERCKDENLLKKDAPITWSGYTRIAVAYYPKGTFGQYLSALEIRLNNEKLATDKNSMESHLLVFANGIDVGGAHIRTGFGVTTKLALASPDMATYTKGQLYDYSLYGIVGTTF